MFAPITDAVRQDAGVTLGFNVLDVGTGPGEPALTIAEFLGRNGNVCGLDPGPEMIAAARRVADRQDINNVWDVHDRLKKLLFAGILDVAS